MHTHRSNHLVSSSLRSRALAWGAGLALTLLGAMQTSSATTTPSVAPARDATAAPVKTTPICPDGRICWGSRCFCI